MKALLHSAPTVGEPLHLLNAVERANERQKHVLVDRIVERFGDDLQGRRFALWGLAFKPDTDDMREAPSRVIVAELLRRGAQVVAHDPVAMDEARRVFAGARRPGLRRHAQRGARRRRRAGGGDRMEGLPLARLRTHARRAAPAGGLRRPQPVRPRAHADARLRVLARSGGVLAPPMAETKAFDHGWRHEHACSSPARPASSACTWRWRCCGAATRSWAWTT